MSTNDLQCGRNTFDRFTLTSGINNTFAFTIKANGSTLPVNLRDGDSVTAIFRSLADGTVILTKSLDLSLELNPNSGQMENLNGRATLELSPEDVELFSGERGTKADRYYLKPTCSLILDCNTADNGVFIARIPYVYID